MERQRSPASSSSSYHCHLLSPRSLPLVSVASLSLLFTLILALRHGLPLHHPLAFATAPAPVFVGGGAYWGDPSAAEVEEAVLGLGRGDSVAEGARPAVAGDLSVQGVGSATETQETASGVGDGGAPSNGDVLKGQEVGEARNHSHGGLDSSVEVKKAAPQGRAKEPAKDLVSDMADASAEKLEGTGSLRDVDFSMEASVSVPFPLHRPRPGLRPLLPPHRIRTAPAFITTPAARLAVASCPAAADRGARGAMEKQRSSSSTSSYHLLSPKSLLLLSFASSSLLFSFLFALFALRHGRPLHLPFASAPIGANASAVSIARAPYLGGSVGGAGVAEVDVAVRGSRSRDWAVEGNRRVVPGDRSSAPPVGSAIEVKGAVTGGGNGGAPANGEVLEGQEVEEAGNYSIGALDLSMEAKDEVVRVGGDGENLEKDSMSEKPNSAEGTATETRLDVGDASASLEATATTEKLQGTESVKAVNFSTEASGTAIEVRGKAIIGQKRTKTLRIDTIDRSSSRWKGADVIVFNTAHWWSHHKTKAGVNYYQEGDHVHPHLDSPTAFQRALTTWASWVDRYINPQQTRVFFRSSSPSHFRYGP
ncbi:hypothetical protein HU200_023030 [Digitaria exilis]|uniref:Trichome birefringence-like C-terminal domain-containing protein n=1 Tax=Digitaria exilis TaxID=1010633 RepID=A0A835C3P4_9POAL|nr:hypothetical protein HU200_023030 [Digitaria exilis]